MWSEDIEANTSLKLRAFMRANFTALDSRVDGGASISWKVLNTFRLIILVCTIALVSVALPGYQSKWYCIPNAIPECSAVENAQLAPKPASAHNKLTPINCAPAPKKCMHRTFTQQKPQHCLNIVLQVGSLYMSDGLKTDFATTGPPSLLRQSTIGIRRHSGIALTLKKPSKKYTSFILRRFGLFLIHLQSKN